MALNKITYCKNCRNGGEIKDFMVKCKILGYFQHSPANCKIYVEKCVV